VAVCHCSTCQKNTGSAFSLNVGLPSSSVTVTGESLATYEDHTGASGKPVLSGILLPLWFSDLRTRRSLFGHHFHQGGNIGRSIVGEARNTHVVR